MGHREFLVEYWESLVDHRKYLVDHKEFLVEYWESGGSQGVWWNIEIP